MAPRRCGSHSKVGSLTPGEEADIIILDATAINVAPLNQVPGAVVSLMDRTNVETVIVAGKVRKWKGRLLGVDLPRLRQQLEASRDYIFNKIPVGNPPVILRIDAACSASSERIRAVTSGAAPAAPFLFATLVRLGRCFTVPLKTDL